MLRGQNVACPAETKKRFESAAKDLTEREAGGLSGVGDGSSAEAGA
jgi:hypothetical protein